MANGEAGSRIDIVLEMPSDEVLQAMGSVVITNVSSPTQVGQTLDRPESEVLYLASYGATVQDVVPVLQIDPKEVEERRDSVVEKFGTPNMAAAAYQSFIQSVLQANQKGSASRLNDREMRVLGLLAKGLNNRQIAEEIGVTKTNVVNINRNIFRKLNATGKTHSMRRGFESQIFPL